MQEGCFHVFSRLSRGVARGFSPVPTALLLASSVSHIGVVRRLHALLCHLLLAPAADKNHVRNVLLELSWRRRGQLQFECGRGAHWWLLKPASIWACALDCSELRASIPSARAKPHKTTPHRQNNALTPPSASHVWQCLWSLQPKSDGEQCCRSRVSVSYLSAPDNTRGTRGAASSKP